MTMIVIKMKTGILTILEADFQHQETTLEEAAYLQEMFTAMIKTIACSVVHPTHVWRT